MEKSHCIRILTEAAKIYKTNLENKNFIFLYMNENNIEYIETMFLKRNFHHLTGVVITNLNIQGVIHFYDICIEKKLTVNDFELAMDHTTELKMQVLLHLMAIHKHSKIIGDYNGDRACTEIVVGGISSVLGFVMDTETNYYMPNTSRKDDIRNISSEQKNIFAILEKGIEEDKYRRICSLKKSMSIEEFRIKVRNITLIDLENVLCAF